MFWKGLAAFVAVLAFSNALPGYSLAAGVASPPVSSAIRSDGLRGYAPDTTGLAVKSFDISNPASSSLLGTISLASAPRSIAVVESGGTTALLITRSATPLPIVEIYDAGGSGVPTYSGQTTLPTGFGSKIPAGMVAFTASDGTQKLCILDEAPGSIAGGRAYIYGINGSAVSASSYNYEGAVTVGSGSGVTLHSVSADQSAGSNRGLLYATDRGNGALYRIDPVMRTATSIRTGLGLPTHVGVTSDGNLVMVRVSEADSDVRVYNVPLNREQSTLRINAGGNDSVYVSPTGVSYPYEGLWVDRGVLYITKYKKTGFAPGGDDRVHLMKFAAYRDRSNDNYGWSVTVGSDVIPSWTPSGSGPADSLIYTSGTNANPINANRLWWARSGGGAFRTSAMVDSLAPSVVRTVSPVTGEVGGSVTITGFNFTFDVLTQRVMFALPTDRARETEATVTDSSDTQLTATIPSVSAGVYEVYVKQEAGDGTLYDSVRFNVEVTVPAPAPTVSAITPVTGAQGASVAVTITGTNFVSGASAQLTRTGQSPISMTGETVSGSTSITATIPIPAAAILGTWNVAVTNADGQSGTLSNGFTITSPLPAPTISGIEPNSGEQGATVSVTISGTNFVSDASVQLTRAGESAIDLTGESVSPDGLQITASVDIPAAAALGTWNVVVTNPDGQTGELTNGFTINAEEVEPIVNINVERTADVAGDGRVRLSWETSPPGLGVDIWTISGAWDAPSNVYDPNGIWTLEVINNIAGEWEDTSVEGTVGNGFQKYYKIVLTDEVPTPEELTQSIIGKFDIRIAPTNEEPENFFFSVPLIISDTNIGTVFGAQAAEGDIVLTMDVDGNVMAATQFVSGTWGPSPFGGAGVITDILHGHGYGYARIGGEAAFVTTVGIISEDDYPVRTLEGNSAANWVSVPYPVYTDLPAAGFEGSSVGSNFTDSGTLIHFDANASIVGGTANGSAIHTAGGWMDLTGANPTNLRLRPGVGYIFADPLLLQYDWSMERPF